MFGLQQCLIMALIMQGVLSQAKMQSGLRNKHLRIEGEYWRPFLMWECPGHGIYWEEDCPGERRYEGVMWDFLIFMQRARNFTFTLVHEADYVWGECYEANNCTGMVGMVNRKEVDFAIGPFGMSYTMAHSVAFSSALVQAVVKFIIPIRSTNDVWSFLQPLSLEVWICSLASVPVFILLCGLLDFLSSGLANWTAVAGFALRNVLVEHMGKMPATRAHQKAALLGWIWFAFIITTIYAGSLKAMIMRPRLIMPIRDAEDFLAQSDISLVVEDGVDVIESFRNFPPTSIWRRVYERLEFLKFHDEEYWPSECFSNSTQYSGRHAALCDQIAIKEMLHESFTTDEQCNWYQTEDSFFEIPSVMLLQKGSPYLDDMNEIINLANQMGFFDAQIQKYTPNATRCLTTAAIEETNREKHNAKRVLRLEDTYGMFLVLSIGLAGALLVFTGEQIAHKLKSKKGSIERRNNRQRMGRPEKRKRAEALFETLAEIELAEHISPKT